MGGCHRPARAGFTLAETALAMTLLLVGLMTVSAATLSTHALRRQVRELAIAHNAARSVSEHFQAVSAAASAQPGTWSQTLVAAWSTGAAPGDSFDVAGLTAPPGTASAGSVLVITDETATDADLGVALGMPRDLNGDGDATDLDVSADARLLPVVIRVLWAAESGAQRVVHPFFVLGY